MTPEQKANELVDKYNFYLSNEKETINEAIDLALIAVDEILKATSTVLEPHSHHRAEKIEYSYYWQDVKKEIETIQKLQKL